MPGWYGQDQNYGGGQEQDQDGGGRDQYGEERRSGY